MNVIDSFVALFAIDPEGVTKGANKINEDMAKVKATADKTAKDVASKGKEASGFFREMAVEALGFFAVLAGGTGLAQLVGQITEANVQLGLLAKNTNNATQTLQAYANVGELAGGSGADIQATFAQLSKAQTEFAVTGQTAMLPYLRTLGVSLTDLAGNVTPATEVLEQLRAQFATMDRPTANNFGAMMGINQSTMNLLLMQKNEFDEVLRKQKELTLTTAKDAEQSLKLKQAFVGLRQESESLWRGFVNGITPALIKFFDVLGVVVDWLSEHGPLVTAFFTTLSGVITASFLPAVLRAAAAVWTLIAPFALVVGAILAVSAVIALLAEDWYVWINGGKSQLGDFWQFIADGWAEIKKDFAGTVDSFVKQLEVFVDIAKKLWRLIVAIFTGSGDDIKDAGAALGDALIAGFKASFETLKSWWKGLTAFFTGPTATKVAEKVEETAKKAADNSIDYLKGRGKAIDQLAPKTRGQRNNNPGNLEFHNQSGATLEDTPRDNSRRRFAKFENPTQGIAEAGAQLKRYIGQGTNTISKIVNRYAPASDHNNVPAYIDMLTRSTGKGPDDPIDATDSDTLIKLLQGIFAHESGSRFSKQDIGSAIGVPGAGTSVAGVGAPNPAAGASVPPTGASVATQAVAPAAASAGTQIDNKVTIGAVNVHTAATDADGIGRDINRSLTRNLVYQTDSGLS
jgi:hypothetical protein